MPTLKILLFSLTTLWFFSQIIYPATTEITVGFSTYYAASKLLAQGQISAQIYDPVYFHTLLPPNKPDIYNANPPTTSLLLLPFVFFPLTTANALWTWANLAMLLIAIGLLVHTFAPMYISQSDNLESQRFSFTRGVQRAIARCTPDQSYLFISAIFFAMLFRPVITNFQLGQAYIAIAFLMAIVAVTHHRNKPAMLGLALGLAILLKTVGWAIIPLLIWQKKWAALVWTAATLIIIIALTWPFFQVDMWQTYLHLLRQTTHSSVICITAYQTTASLLCRMFGSTSDGIWFNTPLIHFPLLNTFIWFALATSTFITTLLISPRNPTASLMLTLTWAILFAPLGEQYHHTVMLIPLIWLYLQGFSTKLEVVIFSLILGLYVLPLNVNHALYQTGGFTLLAYPRLYAAWLIEGLLIYANRPHITWFQRTRP